jgi:hypothetical protein
VTLDFSRPGKPTDNAFIESFNGKFRLECLNAHWFMSLDDARQKYEAWRRDYNEERPPSAIGNKAPIELVNRLVALGPLLKNQTTGLIDATGTNPLVIDTGQNAVSNFGTVEASQGSTLFVVSKVTNNGSLQAVDGLVAVQGAVSGTGGGTINGTGQIEFGAASNNRIRFAAGSTGQLILDDSAHYSGTISGFGAPFETKLAGQNEPGERLIISGKVYGSDCRSYLPNTLIEVWQANNAGQYDTDKHRELH